jgi:hypothetical protein
MMMVSSDPMVSDLDNMTSCEHVLHVCVAPVPPFLSGEVTIFTHRHHRAPLPICRLLRLACCHPPCNARQHSSAFLSASYQAATPTCLPLVNTPVPSEYPCRLLHLAYCLTAKAVFPVWFTSPALHHPNLLALPPLHQFIGLVVRPCTPPGFTLSRRAESAILHLLPAGCCVWPTATPCTAPEAGWRGVV